MICCHLKHDKSNTSSVNQVKSVTVTAGSNLKHPPQLDLGLSELKSCRFAGNCQEENTDNVGYYGRVSSRLTDGMLVLAG